MQDLAFLTKTYRYKIKNKLCPGELTVISQMLFRADYMLQKMFYFRISMNKMTYLDLMGK